MSSQGQEASDDAHARPGREEGAVITPAVWTSLGLDSTPNPSKRKQLLLFRSFGLLNLRETNTPGATGGQVSNPSSAQL